MVGLNVELDPALHSAILLMIESLLKNCEELSMFDGAGAADIAALLLSIDDDIRSKEVGSRLVEVALQKWPAEERLIVLRG